MMLDLALPALLPMGTGLHEQSSAWMRALSHVAAPVAVTALWQGLVVACALAIAFRLAPRIAATQRFAAWAAGFIAVAALPFVPLLWHADGAQVGGATMTATTHGAWLQLDMRWSMAIAVVWGLASLVRAADLAVHTVRLRRLWKDAVPVALPICIDGANGRMGLRRQVQICSTAELDRPSVIGFFAPRILVPGWLLERLTPAELEQVVLHEAEHLRRGDDWSNLLQKLCLVLFPLNPALWWMERRLCQEREMACDEAVVRRTRAPRAYAACLASLAERGLARRAEALTLGAWQRRLELVDRVHRILARGPRLNPVAAGGFLAFVGCGLVFASVELARAPQLVAFVPEQRVEVARAARQAETGTQEAAHARSVPAALRHHEEGSATRAVAALAVEPPSREEAVRGRTAPVPLHGATHAVAVRATTPETRPRPIAQGPYMVVTAWEQVEIVSAATAQVRSDYDTVVNAEGQVLQQPMEQFTVTKLIFRVVPRAQVQTPAAQPAARNGWLVLQL